MKQENFEIRYLMHKNRLKQAEVAEKISMTRENFNRILCKGEFDNIMKEKVINAIKELRGNNYVD